MLHNMKLRGIMLAATLLASATAFAQTPDGHFNNLTVDSNATVGGTLNVTGAVTFNGSLAAATAKFFRFGYGATGALVNMQSAGTDAAGSAYGTADISQQIDLSTGGASGAVGALTVSQTVKGSPSTDYWAIASRNYVTNLADVSPPPGGSQHGVQFMHMVKNLTNVPGGVVPAGRRMPDTWNLWWVQEDETALPSSTAGAQVGLEFDYHGSNRDDAQTRFARQVVLSNEGLVSNGWQPYEVAYGDYWNSHSDPTQDTFFDSVSAYYAGWTVAALDFSQGTGQRANPYIDNVNRAVTIKFRDGAKFGWNGDGATGTYFVHNNGALEYWSNGAKKLRILDDGEIRMQPNTKLAFDDGGSNAIEYESAINAVSFWQGANRLMTVNSDAIGMGRPIQNAVYTVATLPTVSSGNAGRQAFARNCRAPGEAAGAGTGCMVYVNTLGQWRAVWSGLAPTT
mgnify:CR=1 FL=1